MGLLYAVVALLCAAAPALGQENCNNTIVQGAWLNENTSRACFDSFLALRSNSDFSSANEAHVERVSACRCWYAVQRV